MKRSPIVAVLGHVDHGKTTLLDKIRGTAVAKKEAGGITQMIGASFIPANTVNSIAESFLRRISGRLQVPGLLFIDTPGHEAFTHLRERGGAIADLAILVVDVREGLMPQSVESLEILKAHRTPFVVAANKVDLLPGWRPVSTLSILESLERQRQETLRALEEKLYSLMGQISVHGFNSERFDRVRNFRKEIALVPVSALTGEGLAELLAIVSALAMKFLDLHLDPRKAARGSIMEVRKERGGAALDVILYDGRLRKGDRFLFLTPEGPMESKVRALEVPDPTGKRAVHVDEVRAAAGVRILAPGVERALPGSPLAAFRRSCKKLREEFSRSLRRLVFSEEREGILLCADSLGSLEALMRLLSGKVPIRRSKIGQPSKEEIAEASNQPRDYRVVICFRVKPEVGVLEEAKRWGVRVLFTEVIYRVWELYQEWKEFLKEERKADMEKRMPLPFRLKVLPACIFRRSKPAIVGVKVLAGRLKPGTKVLTPKGEVGEVRSIQSEGKSLRMAKEGEEVAIAIDGLVCGRDFDEGDQLLSLLYPGEISRLEEDEDLLLPGEKEILEELKAYWRRKRLERLK